MIISFYYKKNLLVHIKLSFLCRVIYVSCWIDEYRRGGSGGGVDGGEGGVRGRGNRDLARLHRTHKVLQAPVIFIFIYLGETPTVFKSLLREVIKKFSIKGLPLRKKRTKIYFSAKRDEGENDYN